jgi:hypothetical protein
MMKTINFSMGEMKKIGANLSPCGRKIEGPSPPFERYLDSILHYKYNGVFHERRD